LRRAVALALDNRKVENSNIAEDLYPAAGDEDTITIQLKGSRQGTWERACEATAMKRLVCFKQYLPSSAVFTEFPIQVLLIRLYGAHHDRSK